MVFWLLLSLEVLLLITLNYTMCVCVCVFVCVCVYVIVCMWLSVHKVESAVLLLSSGTLGSAIHPFHFKGSLAIKLPKFDVELLSIPKPPQLCLKQRDVTLANVYVYAWGVWRPIFGFLPFYIFFCSAYFKGFLQTVSAKSLTLIILQVYGLYNVWFLALLWVVVEL